MYPLDNGKAGYTWKEEWNLSYESLWGRIEKFRAANVLEPAQIDKIIKIGEKSSSITYADNIMLYRERNFRIVQPYTFLNIETIDCFKNSGLLMEHRIRYCPKCIQYGYHSTIHQLLFVNKCFLHPDIDLQYRCQCNETYVLRRKTQNIKAFQCEKCGQKIKFSSISEGLCGAWNFEMPEYKKFFSLNRKYYLKDRIIFLLDINHYFDETYRYSDSYSITAKHLKILRDYFFYGKTNCKPILLQKAKESSETTIFDASQALHKYIIQKYSDEIIDKNYYRIVQSRSAQYNTDECNLKLLAIFFLINDFRDERNLEFLYKSKDTLHCIDNMVDFDSQWNIFLRFLDIYLFRQISSPKSDYIDVFNYIYKKYIECRFFHTYNCFLVNEPEKYPDTPMKKVSYSNWNYPVFLVVKENENVSLF